MSVTDVERGLIARYAARFLARGDMPMRTLRQMVFWLNDRADAMNLPLPAAVSAAIGKLYGGDFQSGEFERALVAGRSTIIDMLEVAASETARPEPLARNIELLVNGLALPPPTAAFIELIACFVRFDQVQYFVQNLLESAGPSPKFLAIISGLTVRDVELLISTSGELATSGLVTFGEGNELTGQNGRFNIPFRLNNCLDQTFDTFEAMREVLLGSPVASSNEMSDYDHLAADRDLIRSVLEGASREKARGINILLYGPPGTGKTELSKVTAAAAGLTLYAAGEDVASGSESDRAQRLADLVFSHRLLAGSERSALLFDEMEDIAWQLIKRGGSKVYLNRLLESNPVPVFWTSNNIHEIDPALLRRMTLAVEMRLPPPAQRKHILKRLAERNELALSDREADQLARKLQATPAVFESAVKAAKLSGGGAAALERAANGVIKAISGGIPAKRQQAFPDFAPDLVNASIDLVDLAGQLVKGGNLAFSLCLSGPPGTGKSAFARYLARRLGLEVVHKRASDLLGMYVGESEKRIAEAFEEARDAGAFLIFDEADSFLFDRRDAVRSWEITQVNEMLTWMEEHPFPVCFTTNLMERLDQASLRRFTFHVRYEFMDKKTLARAYQVFFRIAKPSAAALEFSNLTPGDFVQARKQVEVLGIGNDPRRVAELLGDISRGKPDRGGAIGFVAG